MRNLFPTFFVFFPGSAGASVNLNPAPSKTTKERAPANSKAGAPGGGTKQIRERSLRRNQVLLQGQGLRRPRRREIGIDGNVVPRLDVVDI